MLKGNKASMRERINPDRSVTALSKKVRRNVGCCNRQSSSTLVSPSIGTLDGRGKCSYRLCNWPSLHASYSRLAAGLYIVAAGAGLEHG